MDPVTRRNFLMTTVAATAAPLGAQISLEQRLTPPAGKVEAVVDSDTYNEIDDQFAVAYALRAPEKIQVEAVYAAPFHNDRSTSAGDGMSKSYDEILRILGRLNVKAEGFAFRGSEKFMAGAGKPVESAAAKDLIAKAMKPRSGPLYVITIGAPTNVSSALLMEPKIKDRIVVVWLGGQPYDWPTAKEFNLMQDLHASRVLHDSGVAMVNIPTKNVSEHIRTTVPEITHFLKGKSAIADYLCSEFATFQKWKPEGTFASSKVIWDISAVAWVINPAWIPTKVVPSPGLTDDMKYQQLPNRHVVRVATGANRDQIFTDLFRRLVQSGVQR